MKKIFAIFVLSLFLALAASSVSAADKPDLENNGMTAICGDTGEVCEFRVIIRNLRPVNAGEFKVKFEISPSTFDLLEGYSTVRSVSGLAAGGQTIIDIKFVPEKRGTYTVKSIVDSASNIAETNENNNEHQTEYAVPQPANVYVPVVPAPLPPGVAGGPSLPAAEPEPVAEAKEVMESAANPASCGVPNEFRDRMEIANVALGMKWAHGKKYGHLGLEGGYWVELKKIEGNAATVDVDGEAAIITEGQSKEINGVVIYAYDVGSDYIDYCIHESKAQYLKLTCQGCVADSKCLAQGTRIVLDGSPSYCSIDNVLADQEGESAVCQNNYECTSNLCVDGECISPGLIKKIILWFKNLFGG